MKIVGLTGGIGSGKSTVAHMFAALGVPIYIADLEARNLTNTSTSIRKKITALLGDKAYLDEQLNAAYVATKIFSNEELLKKVNEIIHPEVQVHFEKWVKNQHATYCIKEAAILFENDSYKNCDAIILVVAPLKTRINRVIARDNSSESQVRSRIKNQWPDSKKKPLADFIIENKDLTLVEKDVLKIHSILNVN